MTTVRFPAALAITVFSLASHEAFAQAAPEPAATTAGGKAWSFSVSALTYLLPDEPDYAQPTLAADHGRLHLEARYNYEGLHAGSAWAGCNFAVGSDVELALTPMIGVVFGDTSGVAAGYEASLLWRKLDLSSESEYVFDTGESSGQLLLHVVGAGVDAGRVASPRPGGPAHPGLPDRLSTSSAGSWRGSPTAARASPRTSSTPTRASPRWCWAPAWSSEGVVAPGPRPHGRPPRRLSVTASAGGVARHCGGRACRRGHFGLPIHAYCHATEAIR